MKSQSKTTKANTVIQNMETRAKNLFNTEMFGIYEGIIESIDNANGIAIVRIPELDNTVYDECRIVTPASSQKIQVTCSYKVGASVIVGFKQFNLSYPIILGQISPVGYTFNTFIDDEIILQAGKSKITIAPNMLTITCGNSVIQMTESGISMNGKNIMAEGEDLTVDETSDSSSSSGFSLTEYLESIF